jgi:hypothetical protein
MKENEKWKPKAKEADEMFAREEITEMCQKINCMPGQIENTTIKKFSSCPNSIQRCLSEVCECFYS